jgi:glucan phosphoethanolaminetransferase (alkaline phosphatase superfamily)
MTFLLKLKHWQLFALTWGPALLMDGLALIDFRLLLYAFPVAMGLFVLGTVGWLWAIVTTLVPLLPAGTPLRLKRFKASLLLPLAYLLVLGLLLGLKVATGWTAAPDGAGAAAAALLIPVHLLSMAGIFYALRGAAKVLKSVELGREAHLSEYLAELFLLWFSLVGVWVLQPRLNALVRRARAG